MHLSPIALGATFAGTVQVTTILYDNPYNKPAYTNKHFPYFGRCPLNLSILINTSNTDSPCQSSSINSSDKPASPELKHVDKNI
jgi:hypothetical protein